MEKRNAGDLHTTITELLLSKPDPDRDASFAFTWFNSVSGRDTLLKMGNAPGEILIPTIEAETATIKEFLTLEDEGKQKTWMLRLGEITIGAAWIDLVQNHGVKAPSVHLMIGDPAYREKGIGTATMHAMIAYLHDRGERVVYTRHLVSNEAVTSLTRSLGFLDDGNAYTDENGLIWQNIRLSLLK
jgi:RimJ/RimL family protein N-acetyltransferase